MSKKEIFISYAWGGESENIVNEIDQSFQDKGISIIRDKRDLGFKGEIKNFMRRIGKGKFVIVIISDKYLKSENCMFEMLEIKKNADWQERIFPVILGDAKIYKYKERVPYIKHWDDERKSLSDEIKSLDILDKINNLSRQLNLYTDIRNSFDTIAEVLGDLNALTPDIHRNTGFQNIYDSINAQLDLDGEGKASVKDKIGHFLYLKCNRKQQRQKFHTSFQVNIQRKCKVQIFAMCCEEGDVPDSMIQRFREELMAEHLNNNLFYQRVYHTIENNDLQGHQEAIKYELCNRFDTGSVDLQASELSKLISDRKLHAAVVSHQLTLKVWNSDIMKMIKWLVHDFWHQLPENDSDPHFVLFFNFILSDLEEGGIFGLFKKNDHSKVKKTN